MEIRLVGAELFYGDGRTDEHDEADSLFRNFANAPENDRGGKLTFHVYLVSRLRMLGAVPPLSHTPSWRSAYFSTFYACPRCVIVIAFVLFCVHSLLARQRIVGCLLR